MNKREMCSKDKENFGRTEDIITEGRTTPNAEVKTDKQEQCSFMLNVPPRSMTIYLEPTENMDLDTSLPSWCKGRYLQ